MTLFDMYKPEIKALNQLQLNLDLKLGYRVYSLKYGWGTVVQNKDLFYPYYAKACFPIRVKFDNGKEKFYSSECKSIDNLKLKELYYEKKNNVKVGGIWQKMLRSLKQL